jgi:hypothetical protein
MRIASASGRVELVFAHLADRLGADVSDVTLAPSEFLDLHTIDVEPQDGEPAFREPPGQRETHVPESDDPDGRSVGLNLVQ